MIDAVPDERDLFIRKSLNFKKLKGQEEGMWSLRLNDQYRLIVTMERDSEGKFLLVHDTFKHQ